MMLQVVVGGLRGEQEKRDRARLDVEVADRLLRLARLGGLARLGRLAWLGRLARIGGFTRVGGLGGIDGSGLGDTKRQRGQTDEGKRHRFPSKHANSSSS